MPLELILALIAAVLGIVSITFAMLAIRWSSRPKPKKRDKRSENCEEQGNE